MRISLPEPTADDEVLLDAFQAYLVRRGLAPATVRVYLHDLKVFRDWLAFDELCIRGIEVVVNLGLAHRPRLTLMQYNQPALLHAQHRACESCPLAFT